MLTSVDIVLKILIVLVGIGTIVYGYWRWRWYHEKKDRWWYVIGLLIVAEVFWEYLKRILGGDPQLMSWSRNIVAAVIIVVCIFIYKRFRLE